MKPPPPAEIRAEDELVAADVRVMLTAPSRTALLENLGITGEDASDLLPLLDAAAADAEVLAEVRAVAAGRAPQNVVNSPRSRAEGAR